ncbi:uncharacterized protein B0I36DRAFT_382029 [Microdochium trichocladiopsis]|uniref:PWWP domain-containing protein n=1 Tax=Microdochium trichocladiopsis TaxID=1682393 RepID=A0A9P8YBE4_9PEZI|nr:uncharacterized protein B0I36DRAFT_382029 [Microdochium trichocladiopsis]KAH7035286.1 hypothetical protein B0I36DRAFT_382029 [Microdochium trichocladiopsis]
MADESSPAQPAVQNNEAAAPAPKDNAVTEPTSTDAGATDAAPAAAGAKDVEMKDVKDKDDQTAEKPSAADEPTSKPAEADAKQESADATAQGETSDEKPAERDSETKADDSTAQLDTSAKGRRKSTAGDSKAKTLKKKASKAKILNLDAKPGDHFFAKLKGFPPWPVVICAEDMLPQNMLSSRPVTAAREDGTYRDDFADGGKRAADRTFPVMYLYTNEFSWTPNTDLSELDPETVADMVTSKMRKDLQKAHELAAENNDLQYYRDLLQKFEEEREQALQEREERARAKAAAAAEKKAKASAKTAKTPRKSKSGVDEDGDMDMADIGDDDEAVPKSKTKKRKAEDASETPQRSDSVKKPKIKLTSSSTPKANGVASPKDASSKTLKVKAKPKKVETPKEPELSPEEKKERKQKEILFLRHRLQKGLLNRTAPPQEEEMKSMSEFLGKLETFPDLEADIIKATKINKVLKAMLKLDSIPKDEEFKFTPRSKALLDKWTKILNAAEASTPVPTSTTNGVNGESKTATSNGVKESSADAADKPDSGAPASKTAAPEESTKSSESTKEEAPEVKGAGDETKTSSDAAAGAVESTA